MDAHRAGRYIGQRLPRVEDQPLIRGEGRYVGDFHDSAQWVAAIVRSTHGHAKISSIDASSAEKVPGVHGVYTAASHPELGRPMPGDGTPSQSPLARDRVRYVGEPVAMVLADNRYIAEDAAELVAIQYQALPAVTSIEQAQTQDILLHPDLGTNTADQAHETRGTGSEAFAACDVIIEETFSMGRVSAQPMEPRGLFARYLPETGGLLVHYPTQSVFGAKGRIVEFLGLDPEQVQVVSPDVGGGFGAKNGAYPEEFLVTWAAIRFQRPVKWTGDRFEEFLATTHEREQVHHAKLGLTQSGRIVALEDIYYQDNGAYPNRGGIPFHHTVDNLIGPYDIPNVSIAGHMMLTNKVPQAPYRGAGRPQGHFVIERLMDRAAAALDMDRSEIRMKNLYTGGSVSGTGNFDSGDFRATFQTLLNQVDYTHREERRSQALAEGRYVGLGIANAVEISGGFGFEGAHLTLLEDGRVQLATGAVAHGQGHRTALAQIVADALDIRFEQIVVQEGDTRHIGRGIGTFASRTAIMAGNAAREGSQQFLAKLKNLAAERLEADSADIVWENGQFFVRGVPAHAVTLQDLAAYAKSNGQDAVAVEHYYQSKGAAYGFGSHAVTVEVDRATGGVRVMDYCIVHDGGRIINPLLADGQVIGGTVQGLGTALLEEMIYDETGQPLTTSFLDYQLPGAVESPDITIVHANFPAPGNPEGIKGVGEAGIIPSQAVVLSAIEDALKPLGVTLNHAPVTPKRLFQALEKRPAR